tara:strand:+ start:2050 stop:2199 length:150 start_codon:yes stop_codon:yes gene_type:complete
MQRETWPEVLWPVNSLLLTAATPRDVLPAGRILRRTGSRLARILVLVLE